MKHLVPTGQSIILASQSPRRRELLASTGLEFSVVAPDPSAEPEDARPLAGESTPRFVCRLASQKAASVAQRVPQPALVIGCDTVAEVDGHILGKPRDRADARRMLQRLSGRRHSVWSGLCLIDSASHRSWTDWAETQLDMRPLGDDQLEAYLDSLAWQGKSGAFGYQDGHPWLTIVSGSADNVVGLPLELLQSLLRQARSHSQA